MGFDQITAAHLLKAYERGLFPMAESADSAFFFWIDPPLRGQLPISAFHVPRRLAALLRQNPFEITVNADFRQVITECARETGTRPSTWINADIRDLFIQLHETGHAHSIECWQGPGKGELVGGVYGLALGGAFCAESMFSRRTGASKVALVHLAARLWRSGFSVFDTQYVNPHLMQFGAYEISRSAYRERLAAALCLHPDFLLPGCNEDDILRDFLHRTPQDG